MIAPAASSPCPRSTSAASRRGVRPGAPQHARAVGADAAVRRQDLPRLRGRALHVRRGQRPRAGARPPPPRRPRRRHRRPCGRPGYAQLPRVGHRLLGHHVDRRRRRRAQRVVDDARDGVRPGRLATQGADRRRRAHRARAPGARRPARRAPLHVIAVRTDRAPGRLRALVRRRAARRGAGRAAGRRHRPGRRRDDLLHVGDDGVPEGRPAHPPRLGHNILPPRVLGPDHRRWPRPRPSPPASSRRRRPAPGPGDRRYMAPTPLFHVTACNCLLHPAR